MATLAAGHLATDFQTGALPALLPFLVDRFRLSYLLAALLMLAMTASSSVVQPLFGLWSDRRGGIWLLPGGVALAGVGMALAADAPRYWLVVVLVLLGGLGSAAYHPEGSKFAAYASGRRRASGMSAFIVGGNLGIGLGSVAVTPLVLWAGLRGGLLLAVPSLAVAALLVASVPFLRGFVPAPAAELHAPGESRPGALALLLAVIAFRSLAWFGLMTFVPLYEVSLGYSKAHGNHLLSLMLLAGGLGTIVAGPVADRLGLRRVLLASLACTAPAIALFLLVGGLPGALGLALAGVCVVGTFGVTMVMSQQYLPGRIGVASGLSIGFALGLGGVASVALGAFADAVDLRNALWVCAAAPVIGLALAALLPAPRASGRGLAPGPVPLR